MRFLRPAAFVIGLLLLGYTLSGLVRTRSLLIGTREMDGTIVAVNNGAPTIRYAPTPASVSDWTTRTPLAGAKEGQHVSLLIRSETGQVLSIGSFWGIFGPFMVMGLVGLALLAFGASSARRFARGERAWRR